MIDIWFEFLWIRRNIARTQLVAFFKMIYRQIWRINWYYYRKWSISERQRRYLNVFRIVRMIESFEIFFFDAVSVFADWYFICCSENNIINISDQFIEFETNFRQSIWSFIVDFINNDDIFNSSISIINSANNVSFNRKSCIFAKSVLSYMLISKILSQCDISQCFIFSFDDGDSIFSDVIIKIDDHDVILKNFIFVID